MKRVIYSLAILTAVVSCSKEAGNDIIPGGPDNQELAAGDCGTVLATAGDFVHADSNTKTAISQSGSNPPSFAWKEGDVIGVIPMNEETVQSNYKIREIGENPKQATFDGGVWALKKGKQYAAYYPFRKQAVISNESITLSFAGQRQSGNGSLAHIGDYDVMYAGAVTPDGGNVCFDFNHMVSLVRLQLSLPAGKYTKVRVENNLQGWFARGADLDLSSGALTAVNPSNEFEIALDDIVLESDGFLTVWFATIPTELLNQQEVNVFVSCGSCDFVGTAGPFTTLEAGKAYSYSVTEMTRLPGRDYVDFGLPSRTMWATTNVGAENPEDAGGHFQWAGTQDVTEGSILADWEIYPYYVSGGLTQETFSKYVCDGWGTYWGGEGDPDGKMVLDADDDVAHCAWGYSWCIPTKEQWAELESNCSIVWTSDYLGAGIKGYIVTGRVPGYEDSRMFLPAAGSRNGYILKDSAKCYYWSSSMDKFHHPNTGICFNTKPSSTEEYEIGALYRKFGLSVRPVFR